MSDKMECPGCGSYSSTTLGAFNEGEACPCCQLPASATEEILAARKRAADSELTKRYEEAVQRAARLEIERDELRAALNDVKVAIQRADVSAAEKAERRD